MLHSIVQTHLHSKYSPAHPGSLCIAGLLLFWVCDRWLSVWMQIVRGVFCFSAVPANMQTKRVLPYCCCVIMPHSFVFGLWWTKISTLFQQERHWQRGRVVPWVGQMFAGMCGIALCYFCEEDSDSAKYEVALKRSFTESTLRFLLQG